MEHILTDFERLFTIVKSNKNKAKHIQALDKLVDNFKRKYYFKYEVTTHYLYLFLKNELEKLKSKINEKGS